MTESTSHAIPKASAADLRRRQSTRTAFKLTPGCVEAMNILGSHLRLKPKSLFDHMVQERETLDAIAAKVRQSAVEEAPRVVKTYVISRDAAEILDTVARRRKVPRDALVELSVARLLPLIRKEQIRHQARKAMIVRMERHIESGRKLLGDMVAELGEGDPMSDKMKGVMSAYERAFAGIAEFIRRGEGIETFDTER